jgi:hypothetical protein
MLIGSAINSIDSTTLTSRHTASNPTSPTASASGTGTASSSATGSLDFTNMSPQQLQSTMNNLIKSGRLSFDDSSAMVGMIPTALSKVNYDGQPPAAYNQPINVLATLQAGIEGAQSRGDTENEESLTRALNALQALQGTPKNFSVYA